MTAQTLGAMTPVFSRASGPSLSQRAATRRRKPHLETPDVHNPTS